MSTSLATGALINADTWTEFVARLKHDCRGEGVRDHYTADAIFIVQARRLIYGIDRDYTDNFCIICDESEWFSVQSYWDDLDDHGRKSLDEKAVDEGAGSFMTLPEFEQLMILDDLPDHRVVGWDERWEYISAHFTKAAADAFIKRKAHDYRKGLRVYVDAQSYSWEYNTVKEAIMNGQLQYVAPTGATHD